VYSGAGLKVKDVEGNLGMGWNVSAGGAVSRTVRGLPDDVQKDNLSNARLGWLYNSNGLAISGFPIANTDASPVCAHETADISYITGYFNPLSDTEPDIFNVSAPGLSCQLVIDAAHHIQVIPYRDIKVTPHFDTYGQIDAFTIVNDQGTAYYFSDLETETKFLSTSTPSAVTYFKKEYAQYHNGITYTNSWKLTTITDIYENAVRFEYGDAAFSRNTQFKLAAGGSSTATAQYTVTENFQSKALSTIYTGNSDAIVDDVLDFYYSENKRVGSMFSHIDGFGTTKSFGYRSIRNQSEAGTYIRQFLYELSMGDQYLNFSYKGVNGPNSTNPFIALPDSTTKKIDYWGYYKGGTNTSLIPQVYINPTDTTLERYRNMSAGTHSSTFSYSIAGADRSINADSLKIGTMDSIKYSHGGFTKLIYEPNDYYDSTAGAVVQGGGLRIRQIRDYTGTDTTAATVRNYAYVQPGTSTSSGKPIALPLFEYTTPYSGSGSTSVQWANSTVRSEDDLSPEDKTIIYSAVQTSQSGAGSTLYEYTTPATFWDRSYSTDWRPTKTYVARTNCSVSTFATSDINTYSFPVNANYDFERGLITKMSNYNDAGTKVSESAYTYQRTGTPTVITGFKFMGNGADTTYAKYNINANVDELTSTVTNKVYDLGSSTTYKQNTVNYYYTSAYHKLMTQQKTTNSDGSISRSNIIYVKDYQPTGTLDSASNAIYNLKLLDINFPIETYAQVERGGVNHTVGSSLVKFKKFTSPYWDDKYLPAHKLKFIAGAGVTDFTPSTINSGVFTNDSRYITVENDLFYDYMGYLQTVNDNNRHVNTVYNDPVMGVPLATVANASANELFYGLNYILPAPVDKNPYAKTYFFSVKIQAALAGTFTATLASGSYTHSYSFEYTASTDNKYYRMLIPLTDMGSSFTVSYHSSTAITQHNALLYPDVAEVNTVDYDSKSRLKIAETNTNGKSVYYDYDGINRPIRVSDNERQVLQRTSYVTRNGTDANDMGTGKITSSANGVRTVYLTGGFTNLTNTNGATYTWNFGDSPDLTTTTNSLGGISHEYATLDSFTVSLTITSPFYATKTISTRISSDGNGSGGVHLITLRTDSLSNGSGAIQEVLIYDNATGALAATFNVAQLAWGNQTFYTSSSGNTIVVSVRGPAYDPVTTLGYSSFQLHTPTGTMCANYAGKKGVYSFKLNLTTFSSISVAPSTDSCPLPSDLP